MNDDRSSRRLALAVLVAGALTVGTIAPVAAAPANIATGGGQVVGTTNVRAAVLEEVSPGGVAGFYLWAQNADNANLPTFFMDAFTVATPIGGYWWDPRATTPSYTDCPITSRGLECQFGAFPSGQQVVMHVAFRLPSNASDAQTNCDPASLPTVDTFVCFDFRFGSNSGFVPGKNKSRGDEYHVYDYVSTAVGNDRGATYPFCNLASSSDCDPSLLTASTNRNIGRNNIQFTVATATEFNEPISLAELASFTCPEGFEAECAAAIHGQWSQIVLNGGEDSTDWVKIDLGIYGVNATKITVVYHFWLDSDNNWQLETISERCGSAAGPATTSSNPCIWVQNLQGNASQVSFWTKHNGWGKAG